MLQYKTYSFQLKITQQTCDQLTRLVGCNRFVWNRMLALQKARLDCGIPLLSYGESTRLLKLWRDSEEYGFLRTDGHSQVQQQVLQALDCAFRDAFDRTQPDKRYLRFKKKGNLTASASHRDSS
jgi:putative transposase